MSGHTVTLALLERLSEENKTEELRDTISKCNWNKLRTFCQSLGIRIRRNKYEAYNNKAGITKLLTRKLAAKKHRDNTSLQPPVATKESYFHLLGMILSEVIPPPVLEEMLSPRDGGASDMLKTRAKTPPQKKKMKRPLKLASIEKAGRLLKEIFPPGSHASVMVSAELTRSLNWLEAIGQKEEDE